MSRNHLIYQTQLVAFIDICAQSDPSNNNRQLKLSSIHTHSAVCSTTPRANLLPLLLIAAVREGT